MKKSLNHISIYALLMTSPTLFAAHSAEEIGNSYFSNISKTVTQLGIAFENHQNLANGYFFLNQTLKNHLYYELRAYTLFPYRAQIALLPAGDILPFSRTNPALGYGGVGILGYNVSINPNVTLMPFLRIQAFRNALLAYKDLSGNIIDSDNQVIFAGSKLSMRVNELFATYLQYYFGYQHGRLFGEGFFASAEPEQVNALISMIEFGLPYKLTQDWNFTPYLQYQTTHFSPYGTARAAPYHLQQITNTNTVFAFKLGYQF